MRIVLSSLILLSILSCGKESPVVTDPVISFTLTVTSGVGGSVSSPGGSYTQGKSTSVTATPDPEYVFVNWSNGSTDNPLSITVNSNQTVTANFEKRKYPLTVSITGSGTVSEEIVSAGKSTTEYTSGSVIRLTANPLDGWVFIGWSGSVSSTENPIELTVNESKTIEANFRLNGLVFTRNSFTITNPNGRKIDLLTTLNSNPGIFVYQKNNFKYLIVPGVSDAQQSVRETSPRGKTFVFHKNENGWSNYSIENDEASTWVVRNFDYNNDFFVLGDANEIGDDWRNWKGDIVKGIPNDGQIVWERVNNVSQMGFYHDVSIGNVNSDDIPDILGVGFKFFLGNDNGEYDFVGEDEDSNYENPLIDYRFNRPFAFELFDFDGDGIDEIISADYRETYGTEESNRVSIHKYNNDEEKFKETFTSNSPTELFDEDRHATSIQVFDFNNDGDSDISIARENGNGESFEIWLNNGDLTFSPQFSKTFNCNEFNMLEFEVFDANSDGNLDILLRPETCGGVPTSSFLYSSGREEGNGLRLNDCIWLNDGNGNFSVYDNDELISPLWIDYLFPYLENNILHFVGFEFKPENYDDQSNSLNVDVIDFEVDIR